MYTMLYCAHYITLSGVGELRLLVGQARAGGQSQTVFIELKVTGIPKLNLCNYVGVTSCTHAYYRDSCHFAVMKAFMVATNFLMSNVFSMVRCRECSVIASEGKVSVVVPEIAE